MRDRDRQRSRRRRGPRCGPFLVGALVAPLIGCDGEDAGEVSRPLRTHPHYVLDQPGVIEPSPETQWGAAGGPGWESETGTEHRETRVPHVWSRDKVASLDLASATRRDREITLTVLGPSRADGRPRTLDVRLNGIGLGSLELAEEPSEHRFAAPAAVWRRGENLLELEVDRLAPIAPGRQVGFALARVAYDHPAQVEVKPDGTGVVLAPGTAVGYHFEGRGPARLVFEGVAIHAGRLLARLDEIEPETGAVVGELFSLELELEERRIERALPVPELAGTHARLELSWTSDDSTSRFELTGSRRHDPDPPPQLGVIFISVDTLAARNLPFHGYPRDTAPNLSALAADSVIFEDCRTNAPWTVPSYMSVLTGLYANAHRLPPKEAGNAPAEVWEEWHLADNRWTLAELFQAAGHETAAFVHHQWFSNEFGFEQGFGVFDNDAFLVPKVSPNGGARLVTSKALDWLQGRTRGDPFFLFLHFLDVHGPYCGQPEDRGRFAGDELYDPERVAPVGGPSPTLGGIHQYLLKHNEFAGAEPPDRVPTAAFAEDYDEGIRALDRALGAFLDELRARDLYDSTVLVLSADHGETMDDSDLLFGHGTMDESVLRVPLLIRFPDGRGRGKRIASHVQLVDLYATFLDLLDLPPRPYLHGSSLLPLVDGAEEERLAYVEGGLVSQRCVVRDGWKLVQRNLAKESAPAHLLSQPGLERIWNERILPAARSDGSLDPQRLEAAEPLAATAFERIRAEGLHVQLLSDLRKEHGYADMLRMIRDHYDREELLLYELASDPLARTDVAARHPEKVAELLGVLEAEERRMQLAREHARLPSQPPRLSEQAVEDLRKLGYSE